VTEIDTRQTGDPTQAVSGEYSVCLANETGAPNVRFRNAAALRWVGLLPDVSEARLWYRTDHWDGLLAMEIWVYVHEVGRPVRLLRAELDGGGAGGGLVADDRWHQARGRLRRGDEFDLAAPDRYMDACYIWIRPVEGWDIAHRTFIDRIETVIVEGPRKGNRLPPPAQRLRPDPGAQIDGPGFVLWEGEDAVEHTFGSDGLYVPNHAGQQALLNGGAWLQHVGASGARASWRVRVPQAGGHHLWVRGFWYRGGFRWRVDQEDWSVSGPGRQVTAAVKYVDCDAEAWGLDALMIGWTYLGPVDLAAGAHAVEIECLPDALGFGFDCWVLAGEAFAVPPARRATTD
jgi:hypothetical protein